MRQLMAVQGWISESFKAFDQLSLKGPAPVQNHAADVTVSHSGYPTAEDH